MRINWPMTFKAPALCLLALSALAGSGTVRAQSIDVERLGAAKAFAPGININGALENEAWQGTSAARAARLLGDLPADQSHPIVRDMLRRVVLSGLVPPAGADDAFERQRIMAAQDLATPDEYARFAARNPAARNPALRVDNYIARGNLDAACEISDAIQQGRGDTYWIRLRAACHEMRGETARADLARDILRDRGEESALIVPDPQEGFWVDVMALDTATLNDMMTALAGDPAPAGPLEAPQEGPERVEESLVDTLREDPGLVATADGLSSELSLDPLALYVAPEPEPTFDLASAMDDTSDQGTARLFILGRDGNAAAVAEFVSRATETGLDSSRVLSRIPAVLDPADMARINLPLFARHAVVTRDIGLMQALFGATQDQSTRERLALASDAMGGGFSGRALGKGLETALMNDAPGAVNDVLIALALGSNLTDSVETRLNAAPLPGQSNKNWIAIDYAVDRGARAESLLRFSDMIATRSADDPWTLYRTIRGLRRVGFPETAGQLAAYEFLRGL